MKNQYTWDFAQKYSAIEMMKLGLALLIMTCLGFITNFDNSINLSLGLGLLFLTAIILFYRVEKAIKKNFKDKG